MTETCVAIYCSFTNTNDRNENSVVFGGLLLAIVLAGAVGALTESWALLGLTPTGFAIYLFVGVGIPQYVLSRGIESPLGLGLAVFAIVGAVAVFLGGVALDAPHDEWSVGFSALFVVVGIVLGSIVRNLRDGYRSGASGGSRPESAE